MFIIDLRREDKLKLYLDMVLGMVVEEVREEVVYIANLVWVGFVQFQEWNFDEGEVKEFADNLVNDCLATIDLALEVNNLSSQKHRLTPQQ